MTELKGNSAKAQATSNAGQTANKVTEFDVIVARVRTDSKEKARLTSTYCVTAGKRVPGKVQAFLKSVAGKEDCQDIKSIVAGHGETYFYTEPPVTRQKAGQLAFDEEVRSQIVSRVRDESSHKTRLTSVAALGRLIPGAESDKIDKHLPLLLEDERYPDIHLITNSRGTRYLYSDSDMTNTYARALARGEANDPIATMADVIREESQVYPRPTSIWTLAAPIFNIDSTRLEQYATELIEKPEFADIKMLRASNGAVYLFSETFLNPALAQATVEWEEVGRFQNP